MTRAGDQHQSPSKAVLGDLRSLIIWGRAARQPTNEEELTDRFGVGRGPVRGALAELDSGGRAD